MGTGELGDFITMTSYLRRGALLLGLASVLPVSAVPAFAQHVVTEDEAAKLTFEALTAPPRPVYRPVIRASYRYAAHRHGSHSRVSRVSYHAAASHRHHHRR